MSYLLQYARRPDSIAPRNPAARVDEYARLNRPGLYGDAFVRVFVEHTARAGAAGARSAARAADRRLRAHDQPRVLARDGRASRELAVQGRHAARRARTASATASPPRPSCAERHANTTHREGRCTMSYLKRHGTRRVPQWAPLPGQAPNSAGGFAWAVDVWTRLRRFLILGSEGGSYYASEWTLTRENAQAVEQCVREDGPARGRRDRPRLDRGPGAEERPGAVRARARGRRRRRGDATCGARGAAAGRAHRHAPVPVRAVRRGLPRLGPLAPPRGRPLVRGAAGGRARLPGGQVPPARRA